MPPERIAVVFPEIEAAWAAVERAAPGELAMLFVDKPAKVWESLTRSSRAYALARGEKHIPSDGVGHDARDALTVPIFPPPDVPRPEPVAAEHGT